MTRILALSSISAALLISSAAIADSVTLVGGDVLQGKIVSESDKSVVLDHASLGRIEIARDRVASVQKSAPAAAAAPAVAESPAPAAPVAILPAPLPPPPAMPDGSWKFSLSLGLSGSKNDSNSNWNIRAAGQAKRATESDVTTISSEFYYQTSDGVETDNNVLLKGLEEFLFKDSKWEAFVQATYQNDNYQEWEQRVGGYAGPGYRLIEGGDLTLKLRGGAGASYEIPTATWTPELLFGDELVWKIDARSNLKQAFEIFPDLDQTGEYRFIARLDYEIALNAKNDLKATAGIRDEYDSYISPSGDATNDVKVYVGIKCDF